MEGQNNIKIVEGEWIITIPVKSDGMKDLADLIHALRDPDTDSLLLKPGWQLEHI